MLQVRTLCTLQATGGTAMATDAEQAREAARLRREELFVRQVGPDTAAREDIVAAWRDSATGDRCGRHLRKLPEVLLGRERVLVVAAGSLDKDEGAVVLTSQQLMLIRQGWTGTTALAVSLAEVRTSHLKQGVFRTWLTLHTHDGAEADFTVRDAADRTRLDETLRLLRGTLAAPDPSSVNVSVSMAAEPAAEPQDLLDRIAKLGALHAAGVLADAEFERKKRQLLDRL